MKYKDLSTAYLVFAGFCIFLLLVALSSSGSYAGAWASLIAKYLFLFLFLPILILWTALMYIKNRRKNQLTIGQPADASTIVPNTEKSIEPFSYTPKYNYKNIRIKFSGSTRHGQTKYAIPNEMGIFFCTKENDQQKTTFFTNVSIGSVLFEFYYSWRPVFIEYSHIDKIELVKTLTGNYRLRMCYRTGNSKKVSAEMQSWFYQSEEWDHDRYPNAEETRDALLYLASQIHDKGKIPVYIL